jgi:hypothetical protein
LTIVSDSSRLPAKIPKSRSESMIRKRKLGTLHEEARSADWRFRILFVLLVVAGCESTGSRLSTEEQTLPLYQWYRGNTHVHTVLSGHADTSPEAVAKWYLDRGYNFLILSEHNIFIDPRTVSLPADRREDFILIPGEEISGLRAIHTTGMNIDGLVDWTFGDVSKAGAIQRHVDRTVAAGGQPILNHPNWRWALRDTDILGVNRLHMFELFNGHPDVNNYGDDTRPSTEAMWDSLLTQGMLIYGVSSDDAHIFQTISPDLTNPGRGWVLVRSRSLSPDAITDAMASGDFYASNGVYLAAYERGPEVYAVKVDVTRTSRELASPVLRGRHVSDGVEGFRIEFIGPEGRVLKNVTGTEAAFELVGAPDYVRVKVTFTRRHDEGFEEYYAWGQPFFSDDRADYEIDEFTQSR